MTLTTVAAMIARAISLLTSLVSVPLTFRYLGPERYGLWMVLISFIAAMSFADLGIGNGVMNAIAEAYGRDDRELAREYITSALVLMVSIAVVLGSIGIIIFPLVPWIRIFNVKSITVANEGARAFLILFAWFIVNIPLSVVTRAQSGLQRGYWSEAVRAGGNVASLVGLVIAIEFKGSLASLVFASTFGVVISTLVNGCILLRSCPWLAPAWRYYRANAAKKLLKLGLMFFILQCAYTVAFTSDNIVIAQILGAAAVAVYAVPQKLFGAVSLLINMGLTPVWPAYGEAVTRGDIAWVKRTFWTSLGLTLIVAIPVCTILATAGPWILRVAVGKTLRAPVQLLWALGLWGIISAASIPMSMLLNGISILKVQAIIAAIASVSNLTLSIILTRHLGVIGVCFGSIVTQLLIVFPAYAVVIRRCLRDLSRVEVATALASVTEI